MYAKAVVFLIEGPVHNYTFSKVCVFVVIDNESIDLRPHYRFDAFSTFPVKKFDRVTR